MQNLEGGKGKAIKSLDILEKYNILCFIIIYFIFIIKSSQCPLGEIHRRILLTRVAETTGPRPIFFRKAVEDLMMGFRISRQFKIIIAKSMLIEGRMECGSPF